ncbi:hypothetical protein DFJ73DRAFT_757695 [Zopfochytrium polystomum]|nr:hypothetical protein DFJ73DRAFT_757695 [Zopfochytrium polystomum]
MIGRGASSAAIAPIAALLASSCCVVQLLLNAFSIGCAGFAVLDPYAPVFAALCLAALSASWLANGRVASRSLVRSALLSAALLASPQIVAAYNRSPTLLFGSRGSLWSSLVAGSAAALIPSGWWPARETAVYPQPPAAPAAAEPEPVTITCRVESAWSLSGLKCEGCAARIKTAIQAALLRDEPTAEVEVHFAGQGGGGGESRVVVRRRWTKTGTADDDDEAAAGHDAFERRVRDSVGGVDLAYTMRQTGRTTIGCQ